MSTVTGYARATNLVWQLVQEELADIDPTVAAYLVQRAASLVVATHHGYAKASELSYRLADEFATGGPK